MPWANMLDMLLDKFFAFILDIKFSCTYVQERNGD